MPQTLTPVRPASTTRKRPATERPQEGTGEWLLDLFEKANAENPFLLPPKPRPWWKW